MTSNAMLFLTEKDASDFLMNEWMMDHWMDD
jgi:hypothetical protein